MIDQTLTTGARIDDRTQVGTDKAVLILSKHRALRDSLRSLLAAAPWIETLHLTDSMLPALRIITLHRPALVLIVDDLPEDDVPMILSWIRSEGSHCRTLVLTESSERRWRALDLGADAALLAGFPAARLFRAIERLAHGPPSPDKFELAEIGTF